MAELASGAVNSLLGVIRDEASLLSAVRGDVQFIKEEMESMNCFLAHLARTAPPDGDHDEQVGGWMNQVRALAQDCNNCIGIYRYHSNPDIHRARDGLRRYVWWLPWFVRKMAAMHDAALRLRELKDRARDVGERRLRYGVEVPDKAVWRSPSAAAAGSFAVDTLDVDGDEDDGEQAATGRRRYRDMFDGSLDDYFKGKLVGWMQKAQKQQKILPSIAVVSPNVGDVPKLADQALALAKTHFKRYFLVEIPETSTSLLNSPAGVLRSILVEIKQCGKKSKPQQEGTSAGQCQVEAQVPDPSKSKLRPLAGIMPQDLNKMSMLIKPQDLKKIDMFFGWNEYTDRIEKIKSNIEEIKDEGLEQELEHIKDGDDSLETQSLNILRRALWRLENNSDAAGSKQDQSWDDILNKTALMLKEHMERDYAEQPRLTISLHMNQYVDILKDAFPTISKPPQAEEEATSPAKQATKTSTSNTTSLGGDLIREIMGMIKLELRQGLQEYKSDTAEQATRNQGAQGQQILEAVIKETNKKLEKIKSTIVKQLLIKRLLDSIKNHLKGDERTLIIIKGDKTRLLIWEETIRALNQLGCLAAVVIVTATKHPDGAEIYCSPPWEPINYSHAGQYYDRVLQLITSQQMKADTTMFRNILEDCERHDVFWMKIIARTLYSNPNRSSEELRKLHSSLQVSPGSSASIPMKMFKFSYSDLPKEYRSCLLYLAIFPAEYKIRRSTLLGRWLVEGLISKEDWPSSVRHANICFDLLIDRCLVNPCDISATGSIKSCKVSEKVHQFITKIARSQHIVETRLSHHLARHFSIFNDLRLCGSDSMDNFFKQLISEKSQLSMIKVLDLEGCQCSFKENPHYLEVICNKLLLLKYLSLRGTDITKLPSEINKLYELEVLDIRQTCLPEPATKHIMLLRLKHLLAGHRGTMTGSNVGADEFSSVQIPHNIGKMENIEVLSNVKAKHSQHLKDIGTLWRLKKFGVVIEGKKSHLKHLLEAIRNLHECLRSLSITLLPTPVGSEGLEELKHSRKHNLESLSIDGTVENGQLLQLLAGDLNQQLGKVTLSNTLLKKNDFEVLAKLKNLWCVELRNIACTEEKIIFKKNEFPNLSYILVEGFHGQGSKLTEIIFDKEAADKLKKIVLSQTCGVSIHGVKNLPKMREFELNGDTVPDEIEEVVVALT